MNTTYQDNLQDNRITTIEKDLKEIRADFNVLCRHHNDEMGDIKKEMSEVKTNIAWIKWLVQISIGAAVSSAVVGMVNLLGK